MRSDRSGLTVADFWHQLEREEVLEFQIAAHKAIMSPQSRLMVKLMAKKVIDSATADRTNQRRRFEEAARELGCDDDEQRFRETVRKVAKAPPAPGLSKAKKLKAK